MDDRQWEQSALERLLTDGSDEDIRRFFLLLRPAELADLLERIPDQDRLRVIRLMEYPLASEVLREVDEPDREEILDELSPKRIAEIVSESRSDDAADMIGALDEDKARETLARLDPEDRAEIEQLLAYDEETAGGIMQTELVTVPSDATVEQALAAVRASDIEEMGDVREVFVIDADGRLLGMVAPSDLIHAEPNVSVRTVAEPDPIRVPVDMDQEKVASIARDNDLVAVPVVDAQGRLVGQVLHDDVADVIEEEATEDIAQMAGVDPEEMYVDSVKVALKSRAPWLLPAFVGGLLVAAFLGVFEDQIGAAPALAMFLPVVLGMAGNIGTQTSAITVRGLALDRIDSRRAGPVIRRQMVTGIVLGLVFGILLTLFAFLTRDAETASPLRIALALGMSISAAMTVGATMGVAVPLTLHRLGFDPAIATSPFVQTANDVTGAGILFIMANAMGIFG
jgi:magnesium transporter